jgi:uncharacterized integral membrane protein
MARLVLKTIFIIALLLLLVLMSMNNLQVVEFKLPHIFTKPEKQPAALMYFAFFAIGLLAGAVLMTGRRGGSGKSKGD